MSGQITPSSSLCDTVTPGTSGITKKLYTTCSEFVRLRAAKWYSIPVISMCGSRQVRCCFDKSSGPGLGNSSADNGPAIARVAAVHDQQRNTRLRFVVDVIPAEDFVGPQELSCRCRHLRVHSRPGARSALNHNRKRVDRGAATRQVRLGHRRLHVRSRLAIIPISIRIDAIGHSQTPKLKFLRRNFNGSLPNTPTATPAYIRSPESSPIAAF